MEPWYVNRESVKRTLEAYGTVKNDYIIDEKIASGARTIDGETHRRFYPELRTIKLDFPNYNYRPVWEIELWDNEIIELVSLTAGGVSIPTGNVLLRRSDDKKEPPYTRLEISLASSSSLGSGDTFQESTQITALFGWSDTVDAIGALAGTLSNSPNATANAVWSTSAFGVGDILRIGTERMYISEKTWVDSGATLSANLSANKGSNAVSVSNVGNFARGEWITIDTERMRIIDIIGSTLSVERGFDGVVLATHTAGATIYGYTGVQLERGVLGTTIAAHSTDDVIYRWRAPSLIQSYNKALAIANLASDAAAWSRVVGSGNASRATDAKGLAALRDQVYTAYGRKQRSRGV